MERPAPVYLIASERSGTNLLRKLLTQHQDVYFGPSPAHFLKHLYRPEPYYYARYGKQKGFELLVEYALELCYVHFSPWQVKFDRDAVIEQYNQTSREPNTILLAHMLMELYAKGMGFTSYFCKDNNIFDFAFDILNVLPDAKFVYLYRDPRDVVCSQKRRLLQSDSVTRAAKLWRNGQVGCIRARESLGDGRCFSVSYESLVSDTTLELERLCEFLGVSYQESKREVHVMAGKVQAWENLDRPVMKYNTEKYAKGLSVRQIAEVERLCSAQMEYLGYERLSAGGAKTNHLYEAYDGYLVHLFSILRQMLFVKRKEREWWIKRRAILRNISDHYW